jgi:hypothetical protein
LDYFSIERRRKIYLSIEISIVTSTGFPGMKELSFQAEICVDYQYTQKGIVQGNEMIFTKSTNPIKHHISKLCYGAS